ncbi:MAG: ATP-binding protein [Candidatus Sphingomonas colombiensis]|nr:ATP-binding protein [Sphingomonas sp.]WEK43226.1 MAG: ATP-binding protein [Sphingomonas sp.]
MPQPLAQTSPARLLAFATPRESIHDLRNLFGIVSSATHLLECHPAEIRRVALLQAIESAAVPGGELTTNLLAAVRGEAPTKRLELNRQIIAIEPMIQAISQGVSFDLCDDLLSLGLDPNAIEAVICELLANARAAGAAAITIRTRLTGTRAWLTIADNGRGMDPATLARARRCEDRQCTHGAGLRRVQQFTRSAHGQFHIHSRAGRGTVASISLPMVLRLAASARGGGVCGP